MLTVLSFTGYEVFAGPADTSGSMELIFILIFLMLLIFQVYLPFRIDSIVHLITGFFNRHEFDHISDTEKAFYIFYYIAQMCLFVYSKLPFIEVFFGGVQSGYTGLTVSSPSLFTVRLLRDVRHR